VQSPLLFFCTCPDCTASQSPAAVGATEPHGKWFVVTALAPVQVNSTIGQLLPPSATKAYLKALERYWFKFLLDNAPPDLQVT